MGGGGEGEVEAAGAQELPAREETQHSPEAGPEGRQHSLHLHTHKQTGGERERERERERVRDIVLWFDTLHI